MNTQTSKTVNAQKGNAVVIVLVVLVIAAVGALAFLSGRIVTETQEDTIASTQESEAPSETVNAKADETEETAEAGESIETAEASETGIEPGNPVVAKVGDEEITRLDVFKFIQTLPPQMRQASPEQLFDLAQNQIVNSKIVENNIDAESLSADEEVQKQLETAKEQIVRNVFIEREVDKKVTEATLKEAYEAYKAEIPAVEEVKAQHILVSEESLAKDLIAQLDGGADFAALAKEHSSDGTAENGGELGYFSKADVVPEFAVAAFALKEGTYSKSPVKSQFGYHVIKKEDQRMRPVPSFEEAKPFIEASVRRDALQGLLEGWRADAKIELFDINGKDIDEAKSN